MRGLFSAVTWRIFTGVTGHEQKLDRYNETVTHSSWKSEYTGNSLQFFFHDGGFSEEKTKIFRNSDENA